MPRISRHHSRRLDIELTGTVKHGLVWIGLVADHVWGRSVELNRSHRTNNTWVKVAKKILIGLWSFLDRIDSYTAV